MQTTFADRALRAATLSADAQLAVGEDRVPENDGISARGLEILQVLNDVFNTLPGEGRDRENWSGEQD
jgi:hypothetical protein